MQTKISVIIPVFNGEKYLESCFECLDNQTFKDFEVIFVNDLSTDNTFYMLQAYKARNEYVSIINNDKNLKSDKNKNNALKITKGDYIVFIDCDDKISPDYLETLYNNCINNNADVCICDSYIEFDAKNNFEKYIDSLKQSLNNLKRAESYKDLHGILFKIHRAAWGKMYRKDFLLDNNILFDENTAFGDVLFNFNVLLAANGICFSSDTYYFYRVNSDTSLTANKHSKEFFDRKYDIWRSVFRLFKESGSYEEFQLELYQFVYNDLFWLSQSRYFYDIVRKTIKEDIAQHSTAQHSTAQHSTAQHSTALENMFKTDSILKKIYTTPGYLYCFMLTFKRLKYSLKSFIYFQYYRLTKNRSFKIKSLKYKQKEEEICI